MSTFPVVLSPALLLPPSKVVSILDMFVEQKNGLSNIYNVAPIGKK